LIAESTFISEPRKPSAFLYGLLVQTAAMFLPSPIQLPARASAPLRPSPAEPMYVSIWPWKP